MRGAGAVSRYRGHGRRGERGCSTTPPRAQLLSDAARRSSRQEFSFRGYARASGTLATASTAAGVGRRAELQLRAVPAGAAAVHPGADLSGPTRSSFWTTARRTEAWSSRKDLLSAGRIPYRIIQNATNQGVYRQWLRGLREATGDLVWIAEADDDCSPALLETLVPAFAASDVVLAYCQSKQIDGQGREIAPVTIWRGPRTSTRRSGGTRYVQAGTEEIRDSLAVKNTIPNVSAVLMRKPDLSEIEAQLVTLRNAGDWLVYVHLLEHGDMAFFAEALNYHRRHSDSVTIGHGELNLMRETLLVQRHVLDRHPVPPDIELKRDAHLQATYEYLGLHVNGPASYKDHEALRPLKVLSQ